MKRSLLTLALIAAAGAVSAQTATTPSDPPKAGEATRISTEAAAKAALEAEGYKSIGSLRMGADGKWSGSAMRGDKQIAVSVDASGNVSSQ
jgi:hypothetical protein